MEKNYTTNDGWVINQKLYEELLDICPVLNHGEILRLVDLFKSNKIQQLKELS